MKKLVEFVEKKTNSKIVFAWGFIVLVYVSIFVTAGCKILIK